MAEKNKRTAWTVQDVINGKNDDTGTLPKFKSGYSGPKKSTASVMQKYNISKPKSGLNQGPERRPSNTVRRSGGILDYAWLAFSGVIALCLTVAICIYSFNGVSHDGIYYPTRIPTVGGVVKDIIEEYWNGGLGSKHAAIGTAKADALLGSSTGAQSEAGAENTSDDSSLLGDSKDGSTAPNTTVGATMALDTGGDYGDYKSAASYDELLQQLDKALSANDFGFVGTKLSYTEEDDGPLIGYPQSVVEHFTQYMFDNPSKKESFLAEIKDADTFMAKNVSAYVVKLPRVQFTVNMGYDDATLSISGFTDKQMNSGQSAAVSPLLPCMYTIHVSTPGGSKTSEVECNLSEGDLAVNIGVTQ